MSDVLDLKASLPPDPPAHAATLSVLPLRVGPGLRVWLHEQADLHHSSVSEVVRGILTRAQQGEHRYPADVVDWLTRQAAQSGCPGDVEQAVVLVVRHLARRWPNGGRLIG